VIKKRGPLCFSGKFLSNRAKKRVVFRFNLQDYEPYRLKTRDIQKTINIDYFPYKKVKRLKEYEAIENLIFFVEMSYFFVRNTYIM
jgi:hypothetical protein